MKRVFVIHGWEGYPEGGWRPWLKNKLEEKGFDVTVPAMPDTANPTFNKWIPFLKNLVGKPDKDCYFVGHSLGCITILRYLESLKQNQKVGGVILVAGFGEDLDYKGYKGELTSFYEKPIDFEKIKKASKKFIAIHSTDDPYVDIKNNKLFVEKLGAESIIMDNMKHFSGDDGIMKLPIVLEKLLQASRLHPGV